MAEYANYMYRSCLNWQKDQEDHDNPVSTIIPLQFIIEISTSIVINTTTMSIKMLSAILLLMP
jgi:hypothetical protein